MAKEAKEKAAAVKDAQAAVEAAEKEYGPLNDKAHERQDDLEAAWNKIGNGDHSFAAWADYVEAMHAFDGALSARSGPKKKYEAAVSALKAAQEA